MNLDLFTSDLPSVPGTDLDSSDARLTEVFTHGTADRFAAAAAAVEKMWSQSIYDVRVLGYLGFAAFLEHKLAALPVIFAGLGKMLASGWPALGPQSRKEQHLNVALSWLFNSLVRHIRMSERQHNEWWQQLTATTAAPLLRESIASCSLLAGAIADRLGQASCLTVLPQLQFELDRLAHLAASPSHLSPAVTVISNVTTAPSQASDGQTDKPAAAAEPSSDRSTDETGAETGDSEPTEDQGTAKSADEAEDTGEAKTTGESVASTITEPAAAAQEPASADGDSIVLPTRGPLGILRRKLAGFGALIEQRDYQRAAIVAADLQKAIEAFDPREYLPQLLSPFFLLLSKHADALESAANEGSSLKAQALAQLYRVDLDAFLSRGE